GGWARGGGGGGWGGMERVVHGRRTRPHVRDVARLAIVRIDPARSVELARPGLVEPLAAALDRRDPEQLVRAAEELLATDPARARAAAVSLYLIDTAALPAGVPGGSPYRAASLAREPAAAT